MFRKLFQKPQSETPEQAKEAKVERPRLVYEPKVLLDIVLLNGEKVNLFIRGNAHEADVLSRLGLPPSEHRLYRDDKPLEDKSLKEQGIKHHTILSVRKI